MRRIGNIALVATLALNAEIASASDNSHPATEATDLSISCHELINGLPDPEGAVYSLQGKELYRENIIISTEDGIVLSTNGDVRSASHTFDGKKLVRKLYSQTGSHPKKTINVEVFDFKNQTIKEHGKDTCYHNARFAQP